MNCADVAVAMPVAVYRSKCSSAAWVALFPRHGSNRTPWCWGCARAGAGRSVRAPAPCAAAEQAQPGLALVDDIEREYFREFKSGSERGVVPAPADFFELLGLDLDADGAAVRLAYRTLQRIVHPDIAGEGATEMASFLNVAYATLMDDGIRDLYAQDVKRFRKDVGNFNGRPVSRWLGAEAEQRAVFVDESTCIGCRNCTNCAPSTFFIEDEYGRARVHAQWGDEEDAIREAVDMCPVDCIAYIKRSQLALLEYVMKGCSREDIAIMARRRSGNLSTAPAKQNPFVRAEVWLKYRAEARIALDDGVKRMQDEALAAAIARVWLALPDSVRDKGWPAWTALQAQAPVAYTASIRA